MSAGLKIAEEHWRQMTIEDAIAVAHRETGISYSKDDPVLAVVAILNAFGDRLRGMMHDERQRFSEQFSNDVAGVSEAIDHKVDDVATKFQRLSNALGSDTLQAVVSSVAQNAAESERLRSTMRKGVKAAAVFSLLNWLAVAAMYLILK